MNRYLEKIAEIHFLEDGVTYDDQKHDLKISNSYMNEHLKGKDTLQRSILGAIYGAGGGFTGGVISGIEADDAVRPVRTLVTTPSKYFGTGIPHYDYLPNTSRAAKFVTKVGRKPIMAAGALVGGLIGGGLGFAIGGLTPSDKPRLKDAEIIRLERKYDDRINEIEGW